MDLELSANRKDLIYEKEYNLNTKPLEIDHLNIDTFYKAGAYASLYKSYGETVDGRKADDITVSMVREAKPKGLFRYFEENRIRMKNPRSGIYYVLRGSVSHSNYRDKRIRRSRAYVVKISVREAKEAGVKGSAQTD